ncbi:glutaminyl-peptide cyclotransferase [Flaviaesturariibacter amylovorans]|uniref:Glutaminyl-peptide cyclotransferase n=1 Tax=Flaviaesturariibacter amylovorans TaxID=1084520 RepID=A0ABP8GYJ9_9BACT
MRRSFSWLAVLPLLLAACASNDNGGDTGGGETQAPPAIPAISYTLKRAYPHDTASFTEGLSFYNGQLWEGTGQEGRSYLLQTDLQTGTPVRKVKIDSTLFGEGVYVFRDTVYQLTWRNKKALLYDAKSLKLLQTLDYPREGWGLTSNGTELIASDGSSNLYFLEPGTLRLLRTQGVTENGTPLPMLNELEYINGFIWANVWQTNDIVKIDAASGQVVGRMNLDSVAQLAKSKNPTANEMNGIVYHPETKKFYVTGKNWPELYEIEVPL